MLSPLLVALCAIAGCDDRGVDEACGALPDRTACPRARGGSCEDRSCSAIYSCHAAEWRLDERCPDNAVDAGADATPATPDGGGHDGAAPSCDVAASGSSCPPLQLPDCDAALLDACPQTACLVGCEGFLRCLPDGDWAAAYAGYCDEDGVARRND